jgi:hypothetical protein
MYGFDRFPSPAERATDFQRVLNAHWPSVAVATGLPDQPVTYQVWARVVWERDGEQWMYAEAVKWNTQYVKVAINDRRMQVVWTWLRPADVRRR